MDTPGLKFGAYVDVRYGSLADKVPSPRHVRLTPKSGPAVGPLKESAFVPITDIFLNELPPEGHTHDWPVLHHVDAVLSEFAILAEID